MGGVISVVTFTGSLIVVTGGVIAACQFLPWYKKPRKCAKWLNDVGLVVVVIGTVIVFIGIDVPYVENGHQCIAEIGVGLFLLFVLRLRRVQARPSDQS